MDKSKRSIIHEELPNIIPNLKEVNKADSRVIKLFWLVVTLFSVTFLTKSVYFVVVDYLEYPVVTSNKITISKSMLLPPVYICADNPIDYGMFAAELYWRFKISLNLSLSDDSINDIIKYVLASFDQELQQRRYGRIFRENKGIKQVEARYQQLLKSDSGLSLERILLDFSLFCRIVFIVGVEFTKECQIAGVSFDCCENATSFLINTGKCWIIEAPEGLKEQHYPGTRGSMVFVTQRDVAPLTRLKLSYLSTDWRIYLGLPAEWRTNYGDLQTTTYTNVEVGTHVTFELKPKSMKLLGSPYKPVCMKYDDDRVSRYPELRLEFCYSDCEANHTLSKCGCVRVGTIFNVTGTAALLLNDEPICTPTQAIECAHDYAQNVSCGCLMRCKSFDYDISVTKRVKMSDFYTDKSDDQIDETVELDKEEQGADTTEPTPIKTAITPNPTSPPMKPTVEDHQFVGRKFEHQRIMLPTVIQVYYSTLMVQESVQTAKWTVSTLVSTMGGLCSLWMEIGILTLFQLIFYSTASLGKYMQQQNETPRTDSAKTNESQAA